MQVGDILQIPEEQKEALGLLKKQLDSSRNAVRFANREMEDANEKFWGFLRKILPETDGFEVSYHGDSMTVVLSGHNDLKDEIFKRAEAKVEMGQMDIAGLLQIAKEHLIAKDNYPLADEVLILQDKIANSDD